MKHWQNFCKSPRKHPIKLPCPRSFAKTILASCLFLSSIPVAALADTTFGDANLDFEEALPSYIDNGMDGHDGWAEFEQYQPDDPSNLASHEDGDQPQDVDILEFLLDDNLVADNIEPSLQTPDLEALMQAEFAADRGQIDKALALYKAESFKKHATNVFERALSLSIEFENPSKSLSFASAWQNKNPDHIPAWFYVTHLALKAGQYHQAAGMLATILHYDPSSDLGQILTGVTPTNSSDQLALFRALQQLDQNNASLSILRAGLLINLGEKQAALLHVNQALAEQPTNLSFITLKLDILKSLGKMDELWSYLAKTRKQLPQEKELYLYQVRYLIDAGELDKAWSLLLTAHQNTHNADVTLLAGLVGLDSGRYQEAITLLDSLTQNPAMAGQAHYYMAVGYERLGNQDQALNHYEQVNYYELALDASTKAAAFYLQNNNIDGAIRVLTKLRNHFESYATDSYILQAEIYIQQNKKNQAKDLLKVANQEYPDDDRLLFASLKLLDDELDTDQKRQIIAKLLEIDSFNPSYRLADAKLRLSINPDDQIALSIATQVSALGIDDPDYDSQLQLEALLVLANYALSKQNYQAVLDYLQAPYDISPNLDAGILLLRAYQGLNEQAAVEELLKDLQDRFLAQ